MLKDNNSIVSYTTRRVVSNHTVLGDSVPTGFYPKSYSFDFRNIFNHSVATASKNYELTDKGSLHVLRSKKLTANWNDEHFIDDMNKIRLFKPDIKEYHENVKRVVESNNMFTFFTDMSECSKEVTINVLKTVYYRGGTDGIINLQNNLNNIISNGLFNPDCLKLYNLIIYSCPFIFCSLQDQGLLTPMLVFHSPYELVATNLQSFITTFPFENPSVALRMQIRLECAVPNMSALYDSFQSYSTLTAYGRTGLLFTTRVGLLTALVRYGMITPLTQSTEAIEAITTIVPFTRPRTLSPEELDEFITLISYIIFQL